MRRRGLRTPYSFRFVALVLLGACASCSGDAKPSTAHAKEEQSLPKKSASASHRAAARKEAPRVASRESVAPRAVDVPAAGARPSTDPESSVTSTGPAPAVADVAPVPASQPSEAPTVEEARDARSTASESSTAVEPTQVEDSSIAVETPAAETAGTEIDASESSGGETTPLAANAPADGETPDRGETAPAESTPTAAVESNDAPAESTPVDAPAKPAGAGASPFTVSVGATTIYQTLIGADQGNDALVGYLDIVAEAEVAAGTTATIELESIGGNGPDADVPSFASTILGWNSNAGSSQDADGVDRVYLAEVFLSTDVLGHDWVLDFGKIASTSYLDTNRVANDSTAQFLSGSFVNSAATQIPFRGAGVALTWLGSESCDVRLLAMRPDNSGDDATSGVFGAGQVDWFWRAANEREGSCGLYVFSNGAKDDQLGVGLTFDQDGESCTAFARFGWQDEVDVSPQDVAIAWSVGCEWHEPFRGRVDDVIGVAFGVNASHDAALDDETVYEAYYKRVISEHVHASFHAQGMNHPGGDPAEDQVTSLGVRLQINL